MRRGALTVLVLATLLASPVAAQEWRHATSLIGEPKYPEGFAHYDYVNPDAPKGGVVRMGLQGSFDTFNPLLPMGEPAGLFGIFETLMTGTLDEIDTAYGLLATRMRYPDDFSWAAYELDPNARWHDGTPVTVEDVIWSFQKAKELNPNQAEYWANVVSAEQTGPLEVTFRFDTMDNRELPKIIGQLMVLPKHWWEGTGPNGQPRNIGGSTLEPLMGSGPYYIDSFVAGQTIVFKRFPNYWGADKNVNIGRNNFEDVRYEYFRDTTVQFEAFKGDQLDFWSENLAARWATGYDFPAVTEGRILRELFPQPYRGSGLMVGFIPNLRGEKFQDPRIREAFNYAFDFEELNRIRFYGQYERIDSFFYGTELASSGLPMGEELEILQSIRDLVPAKVFTTPYVNPVSGDEDRLRENLRAALGLLTEAGYRLDGTRLVNAAGEQLTFELLLNGPTIEPIAANLQTNLRSIGIDMSIRSVDSPQWINRVLSFDFDMVYYAWEQSLSPGNEQGFFWGSQTAMQSGALNLGGIANPGIDALIEKVISAPDRETLIAATRALDRVLLANHYVIPTYTLHNLRAAYWNRFSHPETLPEYSIGFPAIWWWDADKATRTGGGAR